MLLKDLQRDLPKDKENFLNDYNCIICHNDFNNNSLVTDLPECHHLYHYACISEWFQMNTKCPLCKQDYYGKFKEGKSNKKETQPLIVE